jgi:hypothetical protein
MRYLMIAATLLALPATVRAQQQQGEPGRADRASRPSVSSAEALAAVRGRLLLLVEAQEAHFADHNSYTTSLTALKLSGPGQPHSPVVLSVTHAGRRAWRATGRHTAHPGKSCVIFVGKVDAFPAAATNADGRRPTAAQEREPVCDEP